MHSATLDHTLNDDLLHLLLATGPARVCSERDHDDAKIWLRLPDARPGQRERVAVGRQVRYLHALGLVRRDGIGWSRTDAGNECLAQHAERA